MNRKKVRTNFKLSWQVIVFIVLMLATVVLGMVLGVVTSH